MSRCSLSVPTAFSSVPSRASHLVRASVPARPLPLLFRAFLISSAVAPDGSAGATRPNAASPFSQPASGAAERARELARHSLLSLSVTV